MLPLNVRTFSKALPSPNEARSDSLRGPRRWRMSRVPSPPTVIRKSDRTAPLKLPAFSSNPGLSAIAKRTEPECEFTSYRPLRASVPVYSKFPASPFDVSRSTAASGQISDGAMPSPF